MTRASNSKSSINIECLIVVIAVLITIVFSCIARHNKLELIETFTTSSPGIVERVEEYMIRLNKRKVRAYRYYVSFDDSDGRHHEVQSMATNKREPIHAEGDEVTVRYDPFKADEACIIEGDENLI